MFNLGQLFANDFNFPDSALYYHNLIIDSYQESKFRPYSILYLSKTEPRKNWLRILEEEYPDTTFIPDSTLFPSVYPLEIIQDDFISRQENTIRQCEEYLLMFPQPVDSSLFAMDSTAVTLDTTIILDSLMLPPNSVKILEEITPQPSDSLAPEIPAEKGEKQ